MDPVLIILTVVGWLANPLMTQLLNLVLPLWNQSLLRNQSLLSKQNVLRSNLILIGDLAKTAQIVNWQVEVHTLRQWLRRFKDAIYDAEDAIYSDQPNERQINEILDNFQLLTDEIKYFLKGLNKREEIPTWRKTTYHLSKSIKERKFERGKLRDWLLSNQSTDPKKNFSLLSITGTGGIGKTVLSQFVFNNQQVQQKFEVMAWVFLCKAATPNIEFKHNSLKWYQRIIPLWQTNDRTDPPETLNEFKNKLESRMKGKKFFMVLDGMWEISSCWDNFYLPLFNSGKKGSKIIVTTQFEGLANMIDSESPMNLNVLDQNEYWELFKECTFGDTNPPSHHSVLENEGRNISQRFGCSPLAAIEVGRELKCSLNLERWNLISHNKFCIADRKDGDIISILGLCYEQLPERLKQCYISCALFPRDYPFEKHELNLIWMGLGSLHSESRPTNYVDDFSKRSFLVNATSQNNRYVFHHVLHELAEYISDGEFLRLEEEIRRGEHIEIPMHTRHVYISANNFVEASEVLRKSIKLRSLVIVGNPHQKGSFMKSLEEVTENLKFLRFLVLPLPPTKLSKTVGNLKYLRLLQFPKNQQKLLKLSNSMLGKYKLKLWGDSTYLLVRNDIDKLIKLYCRSANIIDV